MTQQQTYPFITFLTDFGLEWGPVGVCRAVMQAIAPGLSTIDLSHGIPPFDVRAGAWVLASALPFISIGVHVAVVDPGVGTERLPIALLTGRGDILVGPDNGLLVPAAVRLGGIRGARAISSADVMRHPVSHTFHGRDIFSPAGAHIARGYPLRDIGPPVEPDGLVPAPWQEPRYTSRSAVGEAALLDNFGNIRTNLETRNWTVRPGQRVRVSLPRGRSETITVANTFGEVGRGQAFLYPDSSGYLCIGVNLGSAGESLRVHPGDALELELV